MKVAILFSDGGTLLGALARATIAPDYPAEFVLAVSNRRAASGIETAREHDIPVRVIDHDEYETREQHEEAVTEALQEAGVRLVCLAGYGRLLSDAFLKTWRGKVLSLHPALLPAFRGIDTHARALERGVRVHGCTVLFVDAELDAGPIVAQAAVPVLADDDEETLEERTMNEAHALYPACVELIATNRVRWSSGEVVLARDMAPDALLRLATGA